MARPRLADAAKNRAASKTKTKAKTNKSSDSTKTALAPKDKNKSSITSRNDLAVPGLPTLSEQDIENNLPKINYESYKISNPHQLPETLPQVSDSQLETNKRLAKGAMNAQESEILALQVVAGTFKVKGQQAKTVGEGLKAVNEIEKTTGLMIDLRNQQEITAQKTNQLDYNIYKTDKEASISVSDKETLDHKERLAQTKAKSTKADADGADKELSEKLKRLGLAE